MKSFITTTVLVLSLVSLGYGQTDATYKATLKRMFEVSGSQEMFKTAVTQMGAAMRMNKDIPDDVWAEFEKEMLSTSLDELTGMLAPVYEKHLTAADLKKIIEFYQTPAGSKFAAKNPLIMQESMQIGQEWGMKIAQRMQEALKQRGY